MKKINDSDTQPEKVNTVYQGKMMREGASFFAKFFFSYAKPLMDSSMTQ